MSMWVPSESVTSVLMGSAPIPSSLLVMGGLDFRKERGRKKEGEGALALLQREPV